MRSTENFMIKLFSALLLFAFIKDNGIKVE